LEAKTSLISKEKKKKKKPILHRKEGEERGIAKYFEGCGGSGTRRGEKEEVLFLLQIYEVCYDGQN